MPAITLTFEVREPDTDKPVTDAVELRAALEMYADTLPRVFTEDYGPDAWGGYDGPTVHNVTAKIEGGSA